MPRKRHLRQLDLVLATGRDQLTHLAQHVDPDRLAYLPLGVDTGFFAPDPAVTPVSGRLLQVGSNRRDFATLREAYALLAPSGASLQFVGCDEAGVPFAGVDGVSVRPHLTDVELRDAYRQAEVVVLPLLEGGSSNALNEALACGVPVVATDRPNLADYADPACVTLVPPDDPVAFAAACRTLLKDPARRRSAAEAARRHALDFDWARVREQLLAHYEALLAG
jgi:glycosyltransferase involved in cell wall biosynthesis